MNFELFLAVVGAAALVTVATALVAMCCFWYGLHCDAKWLAKHKKDGDVICDVYLPNQKHWCACHKAHSASQCPHTNYEQITLKNI